MVPSLSLIVLLTDPPLIATIILRPEASQQGYTTTDTNTVSLLITTRLYYNNENFPDKWKWWIGGWYDDTKTRF